MTVNDIELFAERVFSLMPDILRELTKRQSNALISGKITIPQLLILDLLNKKGDMIMSQLAKSMNVTMPAMTGIVDRLVRDGCALRLRDPKDRRIILIHLTKKGKNTIEELKKQRKKIIIDIFGKLGTKDREDYLDILTKIYNILFENKINQEEQE